MVRSGNTRCHAVAGLLCCLLLSTPLPAWAADDAPPPAPRTTLQIGDASIVLIAANDQLYAFVDRIEDNAPVIDADLTIASSDGTELTLSRTADGMFTAPFSRIGHIRDAFTVALRSPDGNGSEVAEIAYGDLPRATAAHHPMPTSAIAIALVSGGIGAIISAMITLRLRSARRRPAAPSVGTAQAV